MYKLVQTTGGVFYAEKDSAVQEVTGVRVLQATDQEVTAPRRGVGEGRGNARRVLFKTTARTEEVTLERWR